MIEPARRDTHAVLSTVGPNMDPCHYGQQDTPMRSGHRRIRYPFDHGQPRWLAHKITLVLLEILTMLLVRCPIVYAPAHP